MPAAPHNPWLHRVAVATACVALLPIVVGAIVTTKKAGMAFPDWPTSDGHGMFAYPWLQSTGAQFLEHGHRLAGTVIGMASIALFGVLCAGERRRWVKGLGLVVLLAVISQGLIGGFRVIRNSDDAALVHGSGAALVFALLACVVDVTGRGWRQPAEGFGRRSLRGLQIVSIATCICVFLQYLLGGFVRHKGMVLHEHLGFAFIAAGMTVWLAMSAFASGVHWFRGPAALLAALTLVQLALGAATWVTKFGFGDLYVPVRYSLPAVATSTLHMLTGTLLFATCVAFAVRVARVRWWLADGAVSEGISAGVFGVTGGAA